MFNATQYEFDIDVNSLTGTVVFAIQIVSVLRAELELTFSGSQSQNFSFSGTRSVHLSINSETTFDDTTWSVTLDEPLNPDDNINKYQFQLLVKTLGNNYTSTADVILYERRK